jgi:hypothetical protein
MQQDNYRREQAQNVRGTNEETDAWEALRREPGLMGRLARRGKHMKRDFVGGRRSFKAKGGSEDGRIDDTHRVVAVTDIEASALNYLKNQDKKQGHSTGSGPRLRAMAAKDDQPLEYMMYKGMKIPSLNDFGMDEGSVETGGREDRGGFTSSGGDFGSNDYGNDPSPSPTPAPAPGDGGGGGGETAAQKAAREAAAAAAAAAAEETRKKKEKLEKVKTERTAKRRGLVDGTMEDASGVAEGTEGVFTDSAGKVEGDEGFNPDDEAGTMVGAYDASTGEMNTEGSLEGIRTDYKGLRDKADYSGTRDGVLTDASGKREGEEGFVAEGATKQGGLSQYQRQADKLGGEAGTKFDNETGYESQIRKMDDQAAAIGGETGLQSKVGTAAGTMGTMAADATNTSKLMEDRGLFAGQIEAKRKAGEKGKMANLRRSMASAGSSPEEIARAEAEASSGAQAGREDALAASMGAMQSKQGQMAQAAGMLQGQAGMYGQQAGMLGQAQNLGLQKIGAQAGMYGQGLQAQTGLMNMGAGLAKDQQTSQMNEISQQQGLTGSMAGMTEAQLQDVVAQQNAAQQKDLAERGLLMQGQANAANRPQGPSSQQQFMDFAKTAGGVKIAMVCIPEGTTIDMASGHKVPIEEIKVGDFVRGLDNTKDEVLQVHQYKEDPKPVRFVTITFDGWRKVNCCDKHRISGKRAEDYRLQDDVGNREITSIEWYNGVNRSYDLLTASGGYRINGVPVNTMIPEMAEMITKLNKNIKLAA